MGSPAILRFFFKKPLFPTAIHTKTGMLFGQHFDGEPPRNLNHVFLRQFGNDFSKKIGMFMFKNENDGATLTKSGFDGSGWFNNSVEHLELFARKRKGKISKLERPLADRHGAGCVTTFSVTQSRSHAGQSEALPSGGLAWACME